MASHSAASQATGASGRSSSVSDSTGPLNQWPRGHRIRALSSGPSVDLIRYRSSTAAGSPHRTEPLLSIYAGQSRNIALASIGDPHSAAAPSHPAPVREGTLAESEDRTARLIHLPGQKMPTVATVPQRPIDLPRRSPALNQTGPRHVYPGGTVGQSAACIDADGICPLIIQ